MWKNGNVTSLFPSSLGKMQDHEGTRREDHNPAPLGRLIHSWMLPMHLCSLKAGCLLLHLLSHPGTRCPGARRGTHQGGIVSQGASIHQLCQTVSALGQSSPPPCLPRVLTWGLSESLLFRLIIIQWLRSPQALSVEPDKTSKLRGPPVPSHFLCGRQLHRAEKMSYGNKKVFSPGTELLRADGISLDCVLARRVSLGIILCIYIKNS